MITSRDWGQNHDTARCMTFTSFEYLGFLLLTATVYWIAPSYTRPAFLLVASYVFYGSRDWRLVLILGATTIASWYLGQAIARAEGTRRQVLMGVTVAGSLGALLAFKLWARGVGSGGGTEFSTGLGASASDIVVPIGLAFYMFQVISYAVDIYRRELEPQPSFIVYASYVAFFPHLLAGPIVRARRLMPQLLNTPSVPDRVRLAEGLDLIFVGIFKKVAVADPLRHVADVPRVGSITTALQLFSAIVGAFFDISGYIDIARGSAKVLGIEMPVNFAQPLTRSRNWTELWRRWQITIMAWFRDYVYRPVRGRNHVGRRDVLGVFATFLAAALWHGLSLGWVIWGVLTATILVLEQQFRRYRRRRRRATGATARQLPAAIRAVVGPVYVFGCILVTLPWTVGSVDDALGVYQRLFTGGLAELDLKVAVFSIWGLIMLLLSDQYDLHRTRAEGRPDPITLRRSFAYAGVVIAIIIFSGAAAQEFIYVQL